MPLTGLEGRSYRWCVVCRDNHSDARQTLSAHLSRQHGVDLIPGCPKCAYYRGRWGDVKRHVEAVHQLNLDREVRWGLVLKDTTTRRPTYSTLRAEEVVPYPLRGEHRGQALRNLLRRAAGQSQGVPARPPAAEERPSQTVETSTPAQGAVPTRPSRRRRREDAATTRPSKSSPRPGMKSQVETAPPQPPEVESGTTAARVRTARRASPVASTSHAATAAVVEQPRTPSPARKVLVVSEGMAASSPQLSWGTSSSLSSGTPLHLPVLEDSDSPPVTPAHSSASSPLRRVERVTTSTSIQTTVPVQNRASQTWTGASHSAGVQVSVCQRDVGVQTDLQADPGDQIWIIPPYSGRIVPPWHLQ